MTSLLPVKVSTPPLSTKRLLQESLEATLVEVPSQALSVWRQSWPNKPTLVLYSREPFLAQIPAALVNEIVALVQDGTPDKLAERLAFPSSDPLLLPEMAVSAALNAELFSQVIWVYPATVPIVQLNGELIARQLLELGAITEMEAKSFSYSNGVATGTVRGRPFRAVHPEALPALDTPVVLHIDLGFFQPLYKGEIKTPLYPLIYQTMRGMSNSGWPTAAVTISYSNLSGNLPLATRFIGPTLADLMRKPDLLGCDPPKNWQRRSNALYLPNFMKTKDAKNLYLEMEKDQPTDATVKYALYLISRELNQGTNALKYLAQTVAIDPTYAMEYISLAGAAEEKGFSGQALEMRQLAHQAMPNNPFIGMQLAVQLSELGHPDQALKIIQRLQDLPWSNIYHPNLTERLAELSAESRAKQPQ